MRRLDSQAVVHFRVDFMVDIGGVALGLFLMYGILTEYLLLLLLYSIFASSNHMGCENSQLVENLPVRLS